MLNGRLMTENTSLYDLYGGCRVKFETPEDGYSYFFGYYDKSPLNKTNSKLLCHRVAFDGRDVEDGDLAEVGYFSFEQDTPKYVVVGTTLAWNWQQGSQLQWLGPDFGDVLIYNAIRDDKFVSIIFDTSLAKERVICSPVYSVHPSGKYALTVCYERHYWCRPGYNYQNIKEEKWDVPYHVDDGIYTVDFESDKKELVVPIESLVNREELSSTSENNNWVEHILYNPTGNRFMFFHRWRDSNQDLSRVYIADSDTGEGLVSLPNNQFYSHYFWKSDETLTIWTIPILDQSKNLSAVVNVAKNIKWLFRILLPIYRLFKRGLSKSIVESISPRSCLCDFEDYSLECRSENYLELEGNGHQSWFKDQVRMLNDTYQLEDGYRYLMVYDSRIKEKKIIGRFHSNYNDCTYRCDLHPRLNDNNDLIVIDSAHDQNRKMMILEGF
jgi:hypothetical protein